jgi:hypothetical protein
LSAEWVGFQDFKLGPWVEIAGSHFSCPVIENFIWIEPVLYGHLYFVPKVIS